MRLPNFLIIGAARSGTTALCHSLQQHPQIHFSRLKEPHFLAFHGRRLDFAGPGDEALINSEAVTDFEGYQQLFSSAKGETAIGEGSVSTLYYHASAISNIERFVPDAKLIVLLRNPIQRAYSSFLYMTAHGYEPFDEFERALDDESRRIDSNWHHIWHYTRMGFYSEQISAFQQAFGTDRVKVLLFEDLKSRSQDSMRALYEYLNVDPEFVADTSTEVNRSGVPRSRLLQRLMYRAKEHRRTKRVLKAVVPLSVREWLRRVNLTRPEMPASARERLRATYRDEIGNLGHLLNRDLSHWLN